MTNNEHALVLSMEESAEAAEVLAQMALNRVVQRASKHLRFGRDEIQPGQPASNAERLRFELNDVLVCIELLEESGLIPRASPEDIAQHRAAKQAKVARMMELSRAQGRLSLETESSPMPILDSDGKPTGYHRDATGEIVTLADEFDDEDLDRETDDSTPGACELQELSAEQPPLPEAGCICRGNWRLIVKEVESLIDQKFTSGSGEEFTFFGVVHGSDDYYYGMANKNAVRLLSCVGSIETHGFSPSLTKSEAHLTHEDKCSGAAERPASGLESAARELFKLVQNKGQPMTHPDNVRLTNAGDTILVNEGALWLLQMELLSAGSQKV